MVSKKYGTFKVFELVFAKEPFVLGGCPRINYAKPYYYYGGPGYYHGHYLRGLPGSPGYRLIHYARRKREAQSAQNVDFGYGYGYLSQKPEKITKKPILQYKLQLLQPYQHQAR